jgi:hypothetical protein
MITRIDVSLVAGWFVGTGVSPSVGYGLGVADEAAGGVDVVTGAVVDVDGTAVGRGVEVDMGTQAAIKIVARMSTIIG